MPAFPIHTLFGYLAGASLRESGHPLSEAIQEEQWLFLQASVTGADFPIMPYFACDQCGKRAKRLAFVAGWFAHVISDALFKGIYPHTCSIDFYGTHYGPVMHPPSEALAYFMAEELYGVDLSVWWREIPRQNGFLDAFSKGRRIYERLMAEAAEQVAQGWRTL